jgi:hypothetical protein
MLINAKNDGDIISIAGRIREAIDDGCLPVLLAVLRSRRNNPELQQAASVIIGIFAESSPENFAAVVTVGGGEYITAAAYTAPSQSEPQPGLATGAAVLESDAGSAGGSRGNPQAGPSQA